MENNLEKLMEDLKYSGLPDLAGDLEKNIKQGVPEFQLTQRKEIPNTPESITYTVNYRKDDQKDHYYRNNTHCVLDDGQQKLEHTFYREQHITAAEAYYLLKFGENTAVNKTLFNKEGQQYNAWISVNINGQKDDYNNFPVNQYHQNYYKKQPFVLADALQKLPVPVKEIEQPQHIPLIEKSLKKGRPYAITMMLNGEETKGYLMVNAKVGRVEVRDANYQRIENNNQQQQQQGQGTANEQTGDVKKNSTQNQRQQVNWKQKNPNKGVSM